MVVVPSPKSQKRLVIVPVELSVKITVRGLRPEVGVPVKLAIGMIAPVPVTVLVLLPSFPVANVMTLLKLAALTGAKRTTRFVELKPGRMNGLPEIIANGPPFTVATPLLKVAPPRLVIVKLVWAKEPTAIVPKLMAVGEMDS